MAERASVDISLHAVCCLLHVLCRMPQSSLHQIRQRRHIELQKEGKIKRERCVGREIEGFVGDVTPQVELRCLRRISGVALNFWFSIPTPVTLKDSTLSALKEKTLFAREIKP